MKLKCDNCGRAFSAENELNHVFPDIPDLVSRLDPGGIVPSGTCPACGSLVYVTANARGAATNGGAKATMPPKGSAKEFRVEWAIDLSAASFQQAAEKALRIQRKADSIATVFDVTCSATSIRRTVDLSEESHGSEVSGCRVCGDHTIDEPDDHSEWQAEGRIIVVVRGAVAEVRACPEDAIVEIRDYDTDGCDPDQLAEDGSIVNAVTGPIPDWIDDFAAGAAEELADDGLTEAEALAIASEAADIIREHEAREAGKEVS